MVAYHGAAPGRDHFFDAPLIVLGDGASDAATEGKAKRRTLRRGGVVRRQAAGPGWWRPGPPVTLRHWMARRGVVDARRAIILDGSGAATAVCGTG